MVLEFCKQYLTKLYLINLITYAQDTTEEPHPRPQVTDAYDDAHRRRGLLPLATSSVIQTKVDVSRNRRTALPAQSSRPRVCKESRPKPFRIYINHATYLEDDNKPYLTLRRIDLSLCDRNKKIVSIYLFRLTFSEGF